MVPCSVVPQGCVHVARVWPPPPRSFHSCAALACAACGAVMIALRCRLCGWMLCGCRWRGVNVCVYGCGAAGSCVGRISWAASYVRLEVRVIALYVLVCDDCV